MKYFSLLCIAAVSVNAIKITNKDDPNNLEHCPDFDERKTLVNGGKAIPWPEPGYNCKQHLPLYDQTCTDHPCQVQKNATAAAQKKGIEDESYDTHADALANKISTTYTTAESQRANARNREEASNVWRGVKDPKVHAP